MQKKMQTENVTLQLVTIESGKVSKAGKSFNGYDQSGERYFIPLTQLESAKIDKENPELPFYIIAVTKEFDEINNTGAPMKKTDKNGDEMKDENGQVIMIESAAKTGKTFTRVQAGSCFKDKIAAINALNSKETNKLQANKQLALEKLAAEKELAVARLSARVDAVKSQEISALSSEQLDLVKNYSFDF
jgi:hypothetical protein